MLPGNLTMTLISQKGLATRNTHEKCKSSIIYHSEVIANVKVCCKKCDLIFDLDQMVLTFVPQKGLSTRNSNDVKFESSITYHSKVLANVKVCYENVTLIFDNGLADDLDFGFTQTSYHKEYTCEI